MRDPPGAAGARPRLGRSAAGPKYVAARWERRWGAARLYHALYGVCDSAVRGKRSMCVPVRCGTETVGSGCAVRKRLCG
eukprot:2355825-Prymnesium_polylepis.2